MDRLSGARLGRFSRRAVFVTNSSQPMDRSMFSSCPSLVLPALRINYLKDWSVIRAFLYLVKGSILSRRSGKYPPTAWCD